MNIKKKLLLVFFTVLIFVFSTVNVKAGNIGNIYNEFDFSAALNEIDSSVADYLAELGITEISLESIFSVSPKKILDSLFNLVAGKSEEPFLYFFICIGIMTLTALFFNLSNSPEIISLIGSSCVAGVLALPLINVIKTAFSVIETLTGFTSAFSGVLCAVISASGGALTGSSYYALNIAVNSVLNIIVSVISSPLVNGMCALAFLSCFNYNNFTERLSEVFKKVYIFFLSLMCTVFSGVSGIKTVLGNSADTLTSKSLKFLVGRSLPVVGGVVSESYQNIISSLSLIKNTAGIFGIITVILTVLPVIFELFMWSLSLMLLGVASELFGCFKVGGVVAIFKDVLTLLIATVAFSSMLFIISTGLLILFRS